MRMRELEVEDMFEDEFQAYPDCEEDYCLEVREQFWTVGFVAVLICVSSLVLAVCAALQQTIS